MKKMLRKTLALVLVLFVIFGMFYNSKASYNSEMQNLIKKDWNDTTDTTNRINPIVATIITAIRVVGVAVAIVMLLVIAMKYMTAAPGEKADIKKSAIVYVVGAAVVFGVTQILSLISTFALSI